MCNEKGTLQLLVMPTYMARSSSSAGHLAGYGRTLSILRKQKQKIDAHLLKLTTAVPGGAAASVPAPHPRSLDVLRGPGEWSTNPSNENHWLAIVWNRVVHDWTVAVALNV